MFSVRFDGLVADLASALAVWAQVIILGLRHYKDGALLLV
jgi:hypothetical protein